jgi:hypothetical protein
LRSSPENSLDLNRAASELGVQKRRIYDITVRIRKMWEYTSLDPTQSASNFC